MDYAGKLRNYIPQGDGHNSDYAHDLAGAADEIDRLRDALRECHHQTDSLRVWNGNGYTYHPPQAGIIASTSRAALDSVPNV